MYCSNCQVINSVYVYRYWDSVRCWPNLRPRVIGLRGWVSTARDLGSLQVFIAVWSSYGITGWEHSLTDLMSMMGPFAVFIFTNLSRYLFLEVFSSSIRCMVGLSSMRICNFMILFGHWPVNWDCPFQLEWYFCILKRENLFICKSSRSRVST